ncbi:LOW QUALITY PROTEIN: hypothetical protein ACHAW6_000255 [Cyclotella cf. meneghiniana]
MKLKTELLSSKGGKNLMVCGCVAAINENNEGGHGTHGNSGRDACQDETHKWAEVLVHKLAGNVYDLQPTEKVIRYHHMSLGFPIKCNLLKAVTHRNLVTFPRLIASAVNEYFPKSDEMQKGHMKQQ